MTTMMSVVVGIITNKATVHGLIVHGTDLSELGSGSCNVVLAVCLSFRRDFSSLAGRLSVQNVSAYSEVKSHFMLV